MAGPIIQRHRDFNRFLLSQGGTITDLNLVSNTNPVVEIDTAGIMTFHHQGFDPETGAEINARQVHIVVNVPELVSLNYPVFRDSKFPDDPYFLGDKVTFLDANGKTRKFKVIDNRPSNTFGCCLLFFEDLEE